MASGGRAGAAIVLGGETNKVLTHSKIPALVYHWHVWAGICRQEAVFRVAQGVWELVKSPKESRGREAELACASPVHKREPAHSDSGRWICFGEQDRDDRTLGAALKAKMAGTSAEAPR
jgi:hypothetical protein